MPKSSSRFDDLFKSRAQPPLLKHRPWEILEKRSVRPGPVSRVRDSLGRGEGSHGSLDFGEKLGVPHCHSPGHGESLSHARTAQALLWGQRAVDNQGSA